MKYILTTLLSLSPPASAAAPDDVSIRTHAGAWWVKNPTAGIAVLAPELGLSAQWRGLELGFSDHAFLTVAGTDHLWGPDLRWSRAWGEGPWAPYSSLGGQVLLGGPAAVLPVGRAEGGARWQKGHLEARLGAELMGSYRALGGGPRLSLGGVL